MGLIAHRDIYNDSSGKLYMRRWFLLPVGRDQEWPFSIKLHKICRSDADRDLHDHPWSFISLILKGQYLEVLVDPQGDWPDRIVVPRGRFSARWRSAKSLHQVLLPEGPVWTLVFTGPRRRVWGYRTDNGWIPWDQYHEEQTWSQ